MLASTQLSGHLARIEGARKQGARELLGGPPDHQVLPPHVLAGVTKDVTAIE
jgi:aldehyde dehydrogenase (NAD+)